MFNSWIVGTDCGRNSSDVSTHPFPSCQILQAYRSYCLIGSERAAYHKLLSSTPRRSCQALHRRTGALINIINEL